MNLNAQPTRRVFAFGCSFTKYFWPTWADILSKQVRPLEYHNHGLMGSGNPYIAHSFHLNNIIHNFNSQDIVVICWSNIFRNDWFLDYQWSQEGNVYANHGKYNSLLTDALKEPSNYLARDLMNIYGVMKSCELSGCRYKHLTMIPLADTFDKTDLSHPEIQPLAEYILPRLERSFTEVLGDQVEQNWYDHFPQDKFNPNLEWDRHPMPGHHFKYLTEIFSDTEFDRELSGITSQAEMEAVNILTETDRNTEDFQSYFESQDSIELC